MNPDPVTMQVESSDSALVVTLNGLTVRVQKYPLRLQFLKNGLPLLSDENGLFWQGVQRGVRFRLTPYEGLYGAGQRAEGINHRGLRLNSYNAPVGCYGFGAQDLNITIPFILSSLKYGIYFEDSYPGYMDLGYTEPNIFEYGEEGGKLSYFFITRNSYPEIIQTYSQLTGMQPLPPRWTMGYIQSRFGYESEAQAREVVQTFRQQHIPLDALVLDLYWFGWGGMGNLHWDNSHWQNPTGMMHDFDTAGVKTILITEPYILQSSTNYSTAYANGYLTPDSFGVPVIMPNFWAGSAGLLDITKPAAQEWFWSFYQSLINQGVGGWWCDLGEPELHPAQMLHYGGSAAKVHNVYSLMWAKLLHEKYRQHFSNQRLFNLIRSGYAGMQRFSTFPWSGDVQRTFEGMQAQIPILLNMGMGGVGYMGSDLGGFSCGNQNAELYTRWLQFGAFCPVMRAHGYGVPTEPIYYDSLTKAIVTDYIRLRYSLMPYNYTLAWENHLTGMPLARPVMFDSLSQVAASNMYDEYLWGPAFLVAPVMNPLQTNRILYLPSGNWFDYWTDQIITGQTVITASAPLDRLPLYVKAGSFVPMIPPIETTRDYSSDTLIVHFYPHMNVPTSEYTLYDDDGKTPDSDLLDQYETVHFTGNTGANEISIQCQRNNGSYPGAPINRKMLFQLHSIRNAPTAIRVGQSILPIVNSLNEFLSRDSAAYWNSSEAKLYAGFEWNGMSTTLTVNGENLLPASVRTPAIQAEFRLDPAYPNPFNASTVIKYSLPAAGHVSLKVFDVLGREVATLINSTLEAGEHTYTFDAGNLASGIYFCQLNSGSNIRMVKFVLIK